MNTALINRRSFLGSTAMAGATLAASSAFAQTAGGGGTKVKFGLIGCGGRGQGAVKDFLAACKIVGLEAELVAVADAFADKAKQVGATLGVDPKNCHGGFDAYQKVIATDCTYVLMATPPAFRPV